MTMGNGMDLAKPQVLDIFARTDAEGETAAPDDWPIDETSGPDDLDDDTAGLDLLAEEGDTGDIRALQRRGRLSVSLEELRAMQARTRRRTIKAAEKKAQVKARKIPKPPPNLIPPGKGTKDVLDRFVKNGAPFIIRQDGHYYYVTEIRCECVGSGKRAAARIKAGKYVFFDHAVGDDITFLGNQGKVTTNLTNLQRPSKNTYNDQEFLIKSLTMQEGGLRVRYDANELQQIQGLEHAMPALTGQAWIWDDAGVYLPEQIFHDTTGENLLYRALRRSAVLYFNWEKRRTGATGTTKLVLIDHLRNVPDTKVKTLSRTSGGAPVLTVPDGYSFTDNPERSDEGAFTAVIEVTEDIMFPIKPIDLGMGSPTKPLEIGLYVQLSLNGISFEQKRQA